MQTLYVNHMLLEAVREKVMRARFVEEMIPSYRTTQRWMKNWKESNAQLFAFIKSPDKWRSKYKAASGNASEAIVRLNQLWEMDSTPGDILLADGKRHTIVGCIDVYSRRLKLHVSKTSNSRAVASCLRKAMMDWGVPESIKTDNGSDYISKQITRVIFALEIEQIVCPPFTPDAKPHIERVFGTFSRGLLEKKAGFIGHSVADRIEIEDQKSFAQRMFKKGSDTEIRMTPEELQTFCDDWCVNIYEHNPHKGLSGKTPFEMVANWDAPIRMIQEARALDVLLSQTIGDGFRTIGRKGIRIENTYYDAPELGGLEGEQARVLFDDHEWGRVYVFAAFCWHDCDHAFYC